MDRETWLKYFEAAPQAVQDYLLDPVFSERERRAQTALGYDHDAWDRVMDAAWGILFAGLSRHDAQESFIRLAGDRKQEDVERAVLLNVVLPLADLVAWDVEMRLRELGVPFSDMQAVVRVSLRPVSYGAAVRRIASQARISLLTEESSRKLRDAFVSYLKGVRTIEQFKENIRRPQAEGGLGFTPQQADEFEKAMEGLLETTRILSEQEYAEWFAKFQEQTDAAAKPVMVAKPSGVEEMISPKPAPAANQALLEETVDAAVAKLGTISSDAYLVKRLRNLISTRLRDVRSAVQLRQMLERDVKVGGMGFSAEQADAFAKTIEESYAQARKGIAEEERKRIEAAEAQQKIHVEERRKRESEEHALWYQTKVKTTLSRERQAQQILEAMKTQAASGKPEAGPPATAVDAVRPPVRLVGLTDELAAMTLAEFRRLAKKPEDSATKVLQKLQTLQEESFERWTEGVEAWRRSPMQQQYLKLVAESFVAGKPVSQVVEEKRATDASLPSSEEIAAIIRLNGMIQL